MTFDRDDEEHFDQEQDELDQQFRAGRQAESDDFASFDASRYLRNRSGRRTQGVGDFMDEEPEELTARRRSNRQGSNIDDLPPVRNGSRRTGTSSRPLTRQGRSSLLNSAIKTDRRGSGFWTLITAMMFEPGLRTILMAAGCFFLLAMVGCCGLIYVTFFRR